MNKSIYRDKNKNNLFLYRQNTSISRITKLNIYYS